MREIKTIIAVLLFALTLTSYKAQIYSLQWQIPVSNPAKMLLDTNGNSYVIEGNLLKKYNSSGVFSWQNTVIGTNTVQLKFDNAGNIIAAGTQTNSAGSLNDYFICKINTSGTTVWQHTFDSLSLNNTLTSFAIDANDNIILTGNTNFSSSNTDITTFKIAPTGNVLWCKSYTTFPGNSNDLAREVIIDSLNHIFVVQTVKTSTTSVQLDSMAVIKYSTAGNFIGSKYFKGNMPVALYKLTHAVLFNNKLHIYYEYDGYSIGLLAALSKIDTTLAIISEAPLTGMGAPAYQKKITLLDVKSYDQQNILFTSGIQLNVLTSTSGPSAYYPFSCTLHTSYNAAYGISDGILLHNGSYAYHFYDGLGQAQPFFILNPSCSITQTFTTKPHYSSNPTSVLGLWGDKYSSIYILFKNNSGAFLERFNNVTSIQEQKNNIDITLFPNPTHDVFKILQEQNTGSLKIELYNSTGQLLNVIEHAELDHQIDLRNNAAGIYFIKLYRANGTITKKIIKE